MKHCEYIRNPRCEDASAVTKIPLPLPPLHEAEVVSNTENMCAVDEGEKVGELQVMGEYSQKRL